MSKKPKVDVEILPILNDYHLFLDGDKYVDMPFCVDKADRNHITALKGQAEIKADKPFGNSVLECEVREHNEFNYSFKVLSDKIQSRMLFRMDEGDGTHWNRHFPIPVDQQQVPTPHFHKKGDDGIEYAYRTDALEANASPLNIHDGFTLFCDECHIIGDNIAIKIQEEGKLPLVFEPESDPLKGIIFP